MRFSLLLLFSWVIGEISPLMAEDLGRGNKAKNRDTVVMYMRKSSFKKHSQGAKLRVFSKRNPAFRYPSARVAAILSTFLPGAGQIYNQSYWKVPIVWGAVAGMGYLVLNNYIWYRKAGFAYLAKQKAEQGDQSLLPKIDPLLVPLSAVATQSYRNKFRGDVDLYGLLFLVVWGLNVVEAAVDAHLKGFDVSPKLSLRTYPTMLSTPWARAYGVGLSLGWGKAKNGNERLGEKSIFREPVPLL